jgi:UDPglucose--hexose-1-phosphate uridylyltransferase
MPDDRCEMVLYTSAHDRAFWELGVEGARQVVDLWAERTEVLGARDDVAYVLVFENHGAEVGATVAHPHGQIYAYEEVPPQPLSELLHGTLVLPPGDDPCVVSERGDWVGWVPSASAWPFGMLLADRRRHGALSDEGLDRDGLAALLVDVLARLDAVAKGAMPYMMWFHQRPTAPPPGSMRITEWPAQPVHVHVTPTWREPGVPRFVAAAELGGGLLFNPVDPTDAAARLRDARPAEGTGRAGSTHHPRGSGPTDGMTAR